MYAVKLIMKQTKLAILSAVINRRLSKLFFSANTNGAIRRLQQLAESPAFVMVTSLQTFLHRFV